MLAYGNQENHAEMGARFVVEAVINKRTYLDDKYLAVGSNQKHRRASLTEVFASFADVLTPSKVDRIYKQEVVLLECM